MSSTVAELRYTLALVVLFPACTKEKDHTVVQAAETRRQAGPTETPRERSHRLVPRLERGGPVDQLEAPLLRLDKKLGIGVRLVLRSPGESKVPSTEELDEIRDLGRPMAEILHRNLSALMKRHKPELTGVGSPGSTAVYGLDLEIPGYEAILLLPAFWDFLKAMLREDACVALPERSTLLVLQKSLAMPPPDSSPARQELLAKMADLLDRRYRNGADPLVDRFIYLEKGKLEAGPAFRDLIR
ncbi:MAG: hypothetical protein ACE5F1_12300 [Planctomycetota bacterium]